MVLEYLDTIIGSIVGTIGKAYMIIQREQRIFTLVSCNFYISTPIMKLEMTVCVIHSC